MTEPAEIAPSAEAVREQLRKILADPLFAGARRLSHFLEFVVSTALAGSEIKEPLIGVEVYGRDPAYNPKTDSIVRAEASRLRAKLREYYGRPGQSDPVRIELPKGSYVPVFTAATPEPALPPEKPRRLKWRWVAGASAVALVAGLGVLWMVRSASHPASIAVMPLVNLGGNPHYDALGSNLTSEITQALVASSQWKVAGLAPNVDLVGRNQMLASLRQSVSADVVLTGSFRVEGQSGVLVNLQLVSVSDGYLLWTGSYPRSLSSLTDAQREFARAAVIDFTQHYTGKALPRQTRYYIQAREAWSAYTVEGLRRSLGLFQQAVRADPSYAPAWAGLADANTRLSDMAPEVDTSAEEKAAREAAAKALALDDGNAEAHAVLGKLYLFKDWEFRQAAQQLQRAVALDPMRVSPNILYSTALMTLGDLRGAEEAITAARSRLPELPELLFQQASVYYMARKFEKVESIGKQLIALQPGRPGGHWLVGLALEQHGQPAAAVAEFESGLQQAAKDDLRTLCALSHAYGLRGQRQKALDTMRRYLDPAGKQITRFTLSYCAALTYTSLGDKPEALRWLEKARDGKDSSFPFFPLDPRFDPLRAEPGFQELAAALRSGR